MDKLRLGIVPIKRSFLSMEAAQKQKNAFMPIVRSIKSDRVEIVDVDDLTENGIAYEYDKVRPIVEKMRDRRIDALFLPFCDFGEESVAAGIAKELRVPTLVWGARDTEPNTEQCRGRDTQCGMLAATKVLSRCGVKFSYIVNCPADSAAFRCGVETFLRAASAVKALKGLRIAKIGERPEPFMSVMANEGELLERFGITVVPVSLQAVAQRADDILGANDAEFAAAYADFTRRVDCAAMAEEDVRRAVALKLAMAGLIREKDCQVASMECWSALDTLKVLPCTALGELLDAGIPVSCEGDINGAVTLAILQACAMGEGAQFFADLTIRHPDNDNAELLWHCGPFPYSLKRPESAARMEEGSGKWELRQGDITVCRFDSLNGEYSIFAGEGHTTEGPHTTGTYVWFEARDWEKWEEMLIFGPYIHHVGGMYGKYAAALRETARYLGVRFDCPDGNDALRLA